MPRYDDEEDELLMALQNMEPCGNCGTDGAKIPCMSGCGEVFYCSRECNMHHASAHRLRCRNLRCSKFNDSDSESGSDSSEEFSDDSEDSEETDDEEEEEEIKPKKKGNKKNKQKTKRILNRAESVEASTSGRMMMDSEVERRIEEKILRRLKKQEENRIAQAIEQRMREEKANWRDDEMNRIILEMRERFQHEISNNSAFVSTYMKKNGEETMSSTPAVAVPLSDGIGNPQDKSDVETGTEAVVVRETKAASVSKESLWNNTCRSFQALRIVVWKHGFLPQMTFTTHPETGIYNVIQEIDGDESFSHISPHDTLVFVNGRAIDETITSEQDLEDIFASFSSPYILKFEAMEPDNGKVHDYTVTWSNGPLGVTLKDDCSIQKIPIVNRLTKKGGSVAVKQNIAIGDVLVAINNIDTIQLGCSLSMSILKKVQLPAKLRFRGVGGPGTGSHIGVGERAVAEMGAPVEVGVVVEDEESSALPSNTSSSSSMSRPATYEVHWGEGPLGLTIIPGMDTHDLPVIKKVTGTGTSPGIEKAQVGDLLESMNDQSTAGLPFEEVVGYLKSTPKPIRLQFRTAIGSPVAIPITRAVSNEYVAQKSPAKSQPSPPKSEILPPSSPLALSRASSRSSSQEEYKILWGDGPLGLTIDARSDASGGAYIKRIAAAGAAAKLSQDCVGDYLTYINDMDVSRFQFQDIVTHLKNAPRPITLFFRRRPVSATVERAAPVVTGSYGGQQGQRGRLSDTPTRGRKPSAHEENGIYYYNVVWQEGTPLGLSLRSADNTCDYPYITRVTGSGSAAHLPNSVIGDCLISVDSRSVHMGDKSFDEVMMMLKNMPKPLTLKFQSKKDDQRGGSSSNMHVPPIQKQSGWRQNRDGSGASSSQESSSVPTPSNPLNGTLQGLSRSFVNNSGNDRPLDSTGGNEEKFSSIQAPFLVQNKLSTGRRQKMLKGLKK